MCNNCIEVRKVGTNIVRSTLDMAIKISDIFLFLHITL